MSASKTKNIRVKLHERAKEVLSSLNDYEREFLVNSILGDAIYDGKMSEELLKFLQHKKAMQIIEKHNLPYLSQNRKTNKRTKQISQQKQNDIESNANSSLNIQEQAKNSQSENDGGIEDIITL